MLNPARVSYSATRTVSVLLKRPFSEKTWLSACKVLQDVMKSAALNLPGDASILHLIDDNDIVMAGTSKGEIHVIQWRESALVHTHVMKGHTAAIRGKRQANSPCPCFNTLPVANRIRLLQRRMQGHAMSKKPDNMKSCWHAARLCLLWPYT